MPISETAETVEQEPHRPRFVLWPERLLGPLPGLKEINLACWVAFVAFLLIPLCVVHLIQVKYGAGSIRQLNSDFVYVYGVGQIAREYPPVRIYDSCLQQQVFLSIHPPRPGASYGPSPYPPFVALFFAPFAFASFETAYLVWLGISLALYLTGVGVAATTVFPGEGLKISLIFCFALAFYPFLFGTLLNGQLASAAVFAVGVAIHQENRGQLFRSGLALSLLSYKPTLLLLLIPMLLVTRRFRSLLGFVSGAGASFLVATAFAGLDIWPIYARMLHDFGHTAGLGGASRLQLWKYLDLNSSFAAVRDGRTVPGTMLLVSLMLASAAALAVLLWKSAALGRPTQWLGWAATLTCTLLLNVYVPIYDSVLVTIAFILTLGALRDLGSSTGFGWTVVLAMIIFLVSWKTESFAKAHGVQPLTIALAVLACVQLLFLYRTIGQRTPQPSS